MNKSAVLAVLLLLTPTACGSDHQAGEGETAAITDPSVDPARDELLALIGAEHEVVLVGGSIDLVADHAEVRPVSLIPSNVPYQAPEPGPFELVLYGADGEQVRTITFRPGEPSPEDGEVIASFSLELEPPVPPLTRIAVVHDGTELGSRSAGPAIPTVAVVAPAPGETLRWPAQIEWSGQDADGDPLTYSALASTSERRWSPLGTSLTSHKLLLPRMDPSPRPGDELLLLLTVSDGLNSSWTVAGPIPVG